MDPALPIVTAPGISIVQAIQNVAPFLPLIATGLCETHVTTALDNGLLYSAAAPMSIFGSLGIAMAGTIALLASIDWPTVRFHGPTHLKNAGLQPTGLGALLLHVNERKHHLHVAEDRLRNILSKKKVRSVEVNLLSPDLFWWNVRLIGFTVFFSALGLVPYVPLRIYSLRDQPFHEVFLPPFLRVTGCAVVAISVQLLFQLRLLEAAYHRLRFLAADTYLKDAGTSLPPFWDSNQRSKSVFAQLRQWLEEEKKAPDPGEAETPKIANEERPVEMRVLRTCPAFGRELRVADAEMFLKKIHRLGSFRFSAEDGASQRPGAPPSAPHRRTTARASTADLDAAERSSARPKDSQASRFALQLAHRLTTIGLCFVQILLLAGVVCILYGYVLCFSLVQANNRAGSWEGPVLWLVLEVVLAIGRIAVWAFNPRWDDPRSPMVLEKVSVKGIGKPVEGVTGVMGGPAGGPAREPAVTGETVGQLARETKGGPPGEAAGRPVGEATARGPVEETNGGLEASDITGGPHGALAGKATGGAAGETTEGSAATGGDNGSADSN